MAVSVARRQAVYLLVGAVLTAAYLAVALPLWLQRGWDERGPLSLGAPALRKPIAGGRPLDEVRDACQAVEALKSRSS
jgi:hypothetical protein